MVLYWAVRFKVSSWLGRGQATSVFFLSLSLSLPCARLLLESWLLAETVKGKGRFPRGFRRVFIFTVKYSDSQIHLEDTSVWNWTARNGRLPPWFYKRTTVDVRGYAVKYCLVLALLFIFFQNWGFVWNMPTLGVRIALFSPGGDNHEVVSLWVVCLVSLFWSMSRI